MAHRKLRLRTIVSRRAEVKRQAPPRAGVRKFYLSRRHSLLTTASDPVNGLSKGPFGLKLGGTMADSHALSVAASDADFAEHIKTYRLFVSLFKYGVIGVVAILIILAFVTL